MELDSLHCLVVAEVEELGVLSDVPLAWVCHGCAARVLVICHFVHVAELSAFIDRALGPKTGRHIVSCLVGIIREQVVADGRELVGGSALVHHDSEVVRHFEDRLDVGSALLGDSAPDLATVAHLHDGDAGALVAHEVGLGLL